MNKLYPLCMHNTRKDLKLLLIFIRSFSSFSRENTVHSRSNFNFAYKAEEVCPKFSTVRVLVVVIYECYFKVRALKVMVHVFTSVHHHHISSIFRSFFLHFHLFFLIKDRFVKSDCHTSLSQRIYYIISNNMTWGELMMVIERIGVLLIP